MKFFPLVAVVCLSLTTLIPLSSCRTTGTQSQVKNRPPTLDGSAVKQGGAPIANRCNNGGHAGRTEGEGWPFNPKEGCYLDCFDQAAAKADFLDQLHRHRIFGKWELIREQDPSAFAMAKYFWDKISADGRAPHSFRGLTVDKIYDGSRWQDLGIKVGDVIMNFNFGQPNHAGIFYSKRGISHARLVVKVTDTHLHVLDGGWEEYSILDELNSQMVWMRPKGLTDRDRAKIQRWAKLFEPVPYDNLLVDDWKHFRSKLHQALQSGASRESALEQAFAFATQNNARPNSSEDTFEYVPPSGLYCSEGAAAIYSYLGILQHGETAIEVATAFSPEGALPDWDLYADALSGFGASGDPKVFMMHNLFYHYFQAFDEARKAGVLQLEGVGNLGELSFADATAKNLAFVLANPSDNHLISQLESLRPVFQQLPQERREKSLQKLGFLIERLGEITNNFNEKTRRPFRLPDLNESQVVASIFYENKAYGPQTFFENGKAFDFKGVFYNSNMRGNQALFIGNWYNSVIEDGQRQLYRANIQTTLYRVNPDAFGENDDRSKCKIGDKAPQQMRGD